MNLEKKIQLYKNIARIEMALKRGLEEHVGKVVNKHLNNRVQKYNSNLNLSFSAPYNPNNLQIEVWGDGISWNDKKRYYIDGILEFGRLKATNGKGETIAEIFQDNSEKYIAELLAIDPKQVIKDLLAIIDAEIALEESTKRFKNGLPHISYEFKIK